MASAGDLASMVARIEAQRVALLSPMPEIRAQLSITTLPATVIAAAARSLNQPFADLVAELGMAPAATRSAAQPVAIVRQPAAAPAEPAIESVQLAATWREAVTLALTAGQAEPAEVVALVRAIEGQQAAPAAWPEIEATVAAYRQRGHRYRNQASFARSINISRPTLQRWFALYELRTGESVRPGRGRAKQR